MSRLAALLIPVLPASLLGFGWGCGPSVQSIHEGNVRFEHCYRLDLDPTTAPSHRLACWQRWTASYSYGQTRDRIEYARRRIRYLKAGREAPLRLEVDASTAPTPAASRGEPAPAPAPSGTPAPPAPAEGQAPLDAGVGPNGAAAPFGQCLAGCRDTWRSCRSRCSDQPGTRERTCSHCRPDYRTCVRRCVE